VDRARTDHACETRHGPRKGTTTPSRHLRHRAGQAPPRRRRARYGAGARRGSRAGREGGVGGGRAASCRLYPGHRRTRWYAPGAYVRAGTAGTAWATGRLGRTRRGTPARAATEGPEGRAYRSSGYAATAEVQVAGGTQFTGCADARCAPAPCRRPGFPRKGTAECETARRGSHRLLQEDSGGGLLRRAPGRNLARKVVARHRRRCGSALKEEPAVREVARRSESRGGDADGSGRTPGALEPGPGPGPGG
jgi:hypothetical protein